MTLRLDPRVPLVWRDPSTLQFGVDPVLAVLPGVTPATEKLVALLVTGVSASGLRMLAGTLGVPGARHDELLAHLAPCLQHDPPPAPNPARVLVLGAGPVATGLAAVLDRLGLRTAETAAPDLVVLVADRVVAPADHRRWLRADVPHLPIVTGESAVTVGPLVVPGESACLHCAALHERDADPAWPAIAAQLAALPAPEPDALRTASAIALAARVVAAVARGDAEPGRELRVAAEGDSVSSRLVAPHPECSCAAPPGSDWAPAVGRAAPPPTSATPESAAPA